MVETLTSLGAEIVKSEPEMVLDMPKVIVIFGICVILGVIAILLYIWGRKNYSDWAEMIGCLIGLLVAIGLIYFSNNPPQKETASTIYVIKVDDQTDLTAISEQFEVTDTEDYPLLTVKAK